MRLYLIKDLKEYKAVYYWTDGTGKRISPFMPTLNHIYEWRLELFRALHQGNERRSNQVDRRWRSSVSGKKRKSERRDNPVGRRASDNRLQVHKDLFSKKVSDLSLVLSSKSYQELEKLSA